MSQFEIADRPKCPRQNILYDETLNRYGNSRTTSRRTSFNIQSTRDRIINMPMSAFSRFGFFDDPHAARHADNVGMAMHRCRMCRRNCIICKRSVGRKWRGKMPVKPPPMSLRCFVSGRCLCFQKGGSQFFMF